MSVKKSTVTINCQKDLDDLFWKEDTNICDWTAMTPHMAEVVVESKKGFNKPNLNGNCVIAAHVTAFARIEMDKAIRLLIQHGISVLYTDTDSIIFSLSEGQKNPLPEGPCFNQFKDELPFCEILSFYSLGPKIYQITYMDNNTLKVKTATKVKGFYLKSKKGKEIIHDALFATYVDNYLKNIDMSSKVGQFQLKTLKKRKLKSVISQKVLTNYGFNKRVAFRGAINSIQTLPYGFTMSMYENEILNIRD
jgi:hypothetical protein